MTEHEAPHHPLENSWTLWFDSKRTAKLDATSWDENLQLVQTLTSVEEFWATVIVIKKPSQMEVGSNYHMFKTGIKPMWEDPANKEGGKWVVTLSSTVDLYNLDSVWEELLMSLIGEYLDENVPGDHITGCVLGKRRAATKISLWTKDKTAVDEIKAIGTKLKEIMKVQAHLEYHHHGDEAREPAMRID